MISHNKIRLSKPLPFQPDDARFSSTRIFLIFPNCALLFLLFLPNTTFSSDDQKNRIVGCTEPFSSVEMRNDPGKSQSTGTEFRILTKRAITEGTAELIEKWANTLIFFDPLAGEKRQTEIQKSVSILSSIVFPLFQNHFFKLAVTYQLEKENWKIPKPYFAKPPTLSNPWKDAWASGEEIRSIFYGYPDRHFSVFFVEEILQYLETLDEAGSQDPLIRKHWEGLSEFQKLVKALRSSLPGRLTLQRKVLTFYLGYLAAEIRSRKIP